MQVYVCKDAIPNPFSKKMEFYNHVCIADTGRPCFSLAYVYGAGSLLVRLDGLVINKHANPTLEEIQGRISVFYDCEPVEVVEYL